MLVPRLPSEESIPMLEQKTLDLFKVVVLDDGQKIRTPTLDSSQHGFVANFIPTPRQQRVLNAAFKPLPITTLFTVEERKNSDPFELIQKQILHYIEVYGLGMPGLFNLEVTNGKIVVLANIRGVTKKELGEMIRKVLYANAPIRELADLIEIIRFYSVSYDLKKVQNNEARIRLYRDGDQFTSGDDAVRYIVFKATNDTLLIKSKKVLAGVKANASRIPVTFLYQHEQELAQVWNRHKRIIMSLKNRETKSAINYISRLSKTMHVPVIPAINKTFIAKALTGEIKGKGMITALREKITLRDKFKFLNLIEWRTLGRSDDVFVIRNGRAHVENDRKVWNRDHLDKLAGVVLASIEEDLAHLKGKKILLDRNVDYGLPISQKQMLGNLPFGTEVSVDGDTIVSGVYWHNDGGARDIDLSSIDLEGNRSGWGMFSGYDHDNAITFSGDVTDATNGAMEFITSEKDYDTPYGLYANNFSPGEPGAEVTLVVGNQVSRHIGKTRQGNQQQWIDDPVVRETFKMASKEVSMGFVREGKFVVYSLLTSNSRVSGGEVARRLIAKALAPTWTVKRLLTNLGIDFTTDASMKNPKYDLQYSGFSVDKLENMLFNR